MPKLPVTARTLIYNRLRDGSIKLSDWAVVNTSLGAMMELRSSVSASGVNVDPYDGNFTDIMEVSESKMFSLFGVSADAVPRIYNTL